MRHGQREGAKGKGAESMRQSLPPHRYVPQTAKRGRDAAELEMKLSSCFGRKTDPILMITSRGHQAPAGRKLRVDQQPRDGSP